MKWIRSCLVLGLAGFFSAGRTGQDSRMGSVLQVVKYDGLKDAVLKNRGKVILIDFWGNF